MTASLKGVQFISKTGFKPSVETRIPHFLKLLAFSVLFISCGVNDSSQSENLEEGKGNVPVEELIEPRPFLSKGFSIQKEEDTVRVELKVAHTPAYRIPVNGNETRIVDKNGGAHGLQKLAISSTTFIPYLNALGMSDRIVASSWADHILDDALKTRVERGELLDLTRGEVLDMERLASSGADILFYDPAEGDLSEKASRIGVLAIPIQEYAEGHPLARADWLRCFGALLGRMDQAEEVNSGIRSRYLALSEKASKVADRPSVLMGSVYQGKWYAPSSNSLAAQWIRDAGGEYVLESRETEGNITLQMEELLTIGPQVDWLGQMGYGPFDPSGSTQSDGRLDAIPAIKNGNIFYCNTKEVDYFGKAILEPDFILADILDILHPEIELDRQPVYFDKVQE